MPIMDKLYGFREFKTVMRAQVVHNCVNEGNTNAVTINNKLIGYSVSGIRTATSLYGGGGRNNPSRSLGRLSVDVSRSHTIKTDTPSSNPLHE